MKRKSLVLGLTAAGLLAGLGFVPTSPVSPAEAGPRYREAPRGYCAPKKVRKARKAGKWRHHERHRYTAPRHTRYYRPAPRFYGDVIWVDGYPARWDAGLRIYIGGLGLDFEIGNHAPRGTVYEDPYCDLRFTRIDHYHRHARDHHHRAVLRLSYEDEGSGYDSWDDDDGSS